MAAKDSDNTDPGLDGNARNFGPEAVKYAAELVERMIRDLKLKRQGRNKDHDRDHDHPYPSVPQETDLVLTTEEELKFLRSMLKDCEEKQKLTPRVSKMGEKNGDSNHPGLDNDTHDFGLEHVKSTVDLFERMIRDTKPRKERTKKEGDHDHPEPSGPQETDLVLMLEEQLKFLKFKMKSCEKEQQEPDTMEKKVAEGLEQELIAPVSQLEIPTKSVVGRICDMNKYEGGGTIDYDDFKTMRLAGEENEENQNNTDSTNGINKRGIFLSRLLVGFLFLHFLRRKKGTFRKGFNEIKERVEINKTKFLSVVKIAEGALTSLRNLKTKIKVKDQKTLQYDEGVEILVRGIAELKKKTDISDELEQLKTPVTTLNGRLYELSDGKVNKVMSNLNREINLIWEN